MNRIQKALTSTKLNSLAITLIIIGGLTAIFTWSVIPIYIMTFIGVSLVASNDIFFGKKKEQSQAILLISMLLVCSLFFLTGLGLFKFLTFGVVILYLVFFLKYRT